MEKPRNKVFEPYRDRPTGRPNVHVLIRGSFFTPSIEPAPMRSTSLVFLRILIPSTTHGSPYRPTLLSVRGDQKGQPGESGIPGSRWRRRRPRERTSAMTDKLVREELAQRWFNQRWALGLPLRVQLSSPRAAQQASCQLRSRNNVQVSF